MNKILMLICVSLLLSCNEIVNKHAPLVTPVVVETGTDYCIVSWDNAGEQFEYAVVLSYDTTSGNSFGYDRIYENISDTIFTIDSLESNTYYKVKVLTNGGNLSPNESFPPLRFKTK